METIYALKPVPNSIKRLIYVYMLGLGTESSKLIKEECKKLCKKDEPDLGFIGNGVCMNSFFTRKVTWGLYKKYNGASIGSLPTEDYLMPCQMYEVDCAKTAYLKLYHACTNLDNARIMISLGSDMKSLEKLFKYKLLQLQQEELMIE
jgi:hypothetical protein